MKKLILSLLLTPFVLFAQNDFKRVKYYPGSNLPIIMVMHDDVTIPENQVENHLRASLRLSEKSAINVLRDFTDEYGIKHIKYQQLLNGVKVSGGEYTAHIKDGIVKKYTGLYFDDITAEQANITAEQALQVALNYLNAEEYMWQNAHLEQLLKQTENDENATYFPQPELIYVNKTLSLKNRDFKLAYEIDLYASKPFWAEKIYVSAVDGEIILATPLFHDADQPAKGISRFSDTVSFNTFETDSGYILHDNTRGGGITTYNMQQQTNFQNAVHFLNADTFWNITNVKKDEAALDAHWGAAATYDYFLEKHNRNSYDNNGAPLISYVHFDVNYSNAFWSGTYMAYGDGPSAGNPYLSIDIVGHEITHGVTQRSANLVYAGESGALNESFSDIFGNAIEYFSDSVRASWLMGEQCFNVIRNMEDPHQFNDPKMYEGAYWANTDPNAFDYGGVHINSGVQNYWFYLLVEGGSGVNGKGDAYNVQAMGWENASKIAYRNLNSYLTSSSDFSIAREFSYEAAADLFGDCSDETKNVMEAWYAVGVGLKFSFENVSSDFILNQSYVCNLPTDISFKNLTNGGTTYHWNFDNGITSSTYSPTTTFSEEGNYTVTLAIHYLNQCYDLRDTVIKSFNLLNMGELYEAECSADVEFENTTVGIQRVQLHGLDYESGLEDGDYSDYSCRSNTILHIDSSYTINVYTNANNREHAKVWIDFNKNSIFEDNEVVFESIRNRYHHTGTLDLSGINNDDVRLNTPLRMRVMSDDAVFSPKIEGACDKIFRGQTEDYSVALVNDWNAVISHTAKPTIAKAEIYPNPVNNQLHVSVPNGEKINQIVVMNILGKVEMNTTQPIIDFSVLPEGVYMVKVETNKNTFTQKIIKQR
jgi:Zn-dependent metalloprotease